MDAGDEPTNKYEVARVIQWRVDELRLGKPALVATTPKDDFISVALREFHGGPSGTRCTPISRRHLQTRGDHGSR
jgi:DNA-directed RNA polymerase subunit K/omega